MPGPVDPRDVEEMARLRRILNGEKVDPLPDRTPPKQTRHQVGVISDATDDMQAIMDIFKSGGTGPVQTAIKEAAVESRPLREALMTQKTPQGVKMGSWEIKVTEAQGVKSYDVSNVHTKEAIAQDLTLYESALCLCKLLNFHVGINSQAVREVLDLEDKYARHRNDAAMFKHRIKQRNEAGDTVRAAVAEDRYQEARGIALSLREQIVQKSKSL